MGVTYGTARHGFVFGKRGRQRHPGGFVHMLGDIVVVTLPADFFNQNAEQQKPVITVSPLAARLEFDTALPIELHVVLQGAKL